MTSADQNGDVSVLVFDMARTGEPDGERLVSGFDGIDAARAYCEARVRSSVEELRSPGRSASDLRSMWHIYGEDCVVIGDAWRGWNQLDRYIAEPATPGQIDWAALAPRPAESRLKTAQEPAPEAMPSRRFHAAVLVSNAVDESVWVGGFLRLSQKPSVDELMKIYRADAVAAFERKGIGDSTPASVHVAHVFELLSAPHPQAGDERPLRNWDVGVDFVCHDIKFGATARGVFVWPEQPDAAVAVAMARVLIGDSMAVRGDGPDYVDYTDILATRISETMEAADYPLPDRPA